MNQPRRDKVFISYSHKDTKWLEKLQTMLAPCKDRISLWEDTKIGVGAKWRDDIEQALERARVAVLLVSPNFLDSDFIAKNELPPILEASQNSKLTIVWIHLSACLYEETAIAEYQASHDIRKPLDTLEQSEQGAVLKKICQQIIAEAKKDAEAVLRADTYPRLQDLAEDKSTPDRMERESAKAITQSAYQGLQALLEMTRDPVVQRNAASFKTVFDTSSKQIEILGFYKDIHDLLQTLEMKCYNNLLDKLRRARETDDEVSLWDEIEEYEVALEELTSDLRGLAQQTAMVQRTGDLIPNLDNHLKKVCVATKNRDVAQLNAALKPLKSLLATKPCAMNVRLVEAARALQLEEFLRALTTIYENLERTETKNNELIAKFRTGIEELVKVRAALILLMEDHDRWQEIDDELRRVDSTLADLNNLFEAWPQLKTWTDERLQGIEEDWAIILAGQTQKLAEAIDADDAVRIRQRFRGYRHRVVSRFYHVDHKLKQLCNQLRRIGEPLALLVESL